MHEILRGIIMKEALCFFCLHRLLFLLQLFVPESTCANEVVHLCGNGGLILLQIFSANDEKLVPWKVLKPLALQTLQYYISATVRFPYYCDIYTAYKYCIRIAQVMPYCIRIA